MRTTPRTWLTPPLHTHTHTHTPAATVLVNRWHPISDDYTVALTELPNGQLVASVCYEDLMQMLSDCAADGLTPTVISGFRTLDDQRALYENKVSRVMAQGYDRPRAEEIAAEEVAYPGTSEHHTGLAVDIVDSTYIVLDETQETRPTQRWLMENCWRYGFILRYPSDKTQQTGIIYEPWHYRYVGREAAKQLRQTGQCLE